MQFFRRRIELDLSSAVLVIVYRQALVWLGMGFSPVIPILGLISNVVLFYTYYIVRCRDC